jgi:hypothetical protein
MIPMVLIIRGMEMEMEMGMIGYPHQRSLSSFGNIALDKSIDQFDLRVSLFEWLRVDWMIPLSFYGS